MQIFSNGKRRLRFFHGILYDKPKISRGKNLIIVPLKISWCVIETSSGLPRKSLRAIFGNRRKFRIMFGNVRVASGQVLQSFLKSSE